jgi:hypothetical protein
MTTDASTSSPKSSAPRLMRFADMPTSRMATHARSSESGSSVARATRACPARDAACALSRVRAAAIGARPARSGRDPARATRHDIDSYDRDSCPLARRPQATRRVPEALVGTTTTECSELASLRGTDVCTDCERWIGSRHNPNVPQRRHLRTSGSDLLVRSERKGGNRGQRDTAAPCFLRKSHHSGQPPKAASRYRLSVICQSARIWSKRRGSQATTDESRLRRPGLSVSRAGRYSRKSASRSRLARTTR